MFDTSTETGARAERRLKEEGVAWLTTVRRDGMPQPVPVWFLWDGETFLVYSQPEARKIKNIRENPRVAMNLNSGVGGDDVVRAEGMADIHEDAPPATKVPDYLEKYRSNIPGIGMSEKEFAETYRTAIRIKPERWQVW
ncbi:MAG: TIGR03667 family PPOX class F420-dependent oxidoreductase [Rubrobacter sp.]|nr:TIGR03667 family PPOX class F420-dependent oxidoreductase [Rubrobacter sp.]